MQSEKVRAFKNELRNYNYYLSRVTSLTNSIEYLYDRLGGVRGIDPSREPTHALPNKDLEYQLRDDIMKLDSKLSRCEAKIKEVDEILNLIESPLKEAIIDVYANNEKCVKIADRLYLSSTGLQKRMNKAIERALNEKI